MTPMLPLLLCVQTATVPAATPSLDSVSSTSSTLTLGDLDGDGLPDAVALDALGRVTALAQRPDGRFDEVTLEAGLGEVGPASCVLLHDLDGDGDVDAYFGSSEVRVWLNAGNFSFTPLASGIAHDGFDDRVRSTDHDVDGRVDLLVSGELGDLLYRGVGGGHFELALDAGSAPSGPPIGAVAPSSPTSPTTEELERADRPASRRIVRWLRARAAGASVSAPGSFMRQGGGITTTPLGGTLGLQGSGSLACAGSVLDVATGSCIEASSIPVIGKLYPQSLALNVSTDGRVGIGTFTPGYTLDVNGNVRINNQLVILQSTGAPPILVSSTTRVNNLNADRLDGFDASDFILGPTVESAEILNGTITDVDIAANAAIAGSKVIPDFGSRPISSTEEISVLGLRTRPGAYSSWGENVIGGTAGNIIDPGVSAATIAGGGGATTLINRITDDLCTIGGGFGNLAGDSAGTTDDAIGATVAGGIHGDATGYCSAIGGGDSNVASTYWATVPGGRYNEAAGWNAFAAGFRAKALHDGAFVWGDRVSADFASTAPNQFLIRAGGGVGIAVNAPLAPLHVGDGDAGAVTPNSSSVAILESGGNSFLQLLSPSTRESGVLFGNPAGGAAAGAIVYNSTVADGFAFRVAGNSTKMVVTSNGNVGIGTNAPAFLLHVDGSAGKPGGGSWSVASDARLKSNVAPLTGALEELLALRGVTFEYTDPEAIGERSGRQVGFIAQEVEPVFPDWVEAADDGYLRVSVKGFEALAVEALRELEAERRRHAEELESLTERLAAQEARLAALERLAQRE